MKYNKFVAPIMAGALSLTLGLVGCGGSSASQSATDASASSTSVAADTSAASSASTTAEEDQVMYWEGDTDKGDIILYGEDDTDKTATILLFGDHDGQNELLGYSGTVKTEGDQVTITDSESNEEFTFTVSDRTAAGMTVDLGEHGKGTVKPVTQKQFNEEVDSIVKAMEEVGNALVSLTDQDLEDLANILDSVINEATAESSASSASTASAASTASTTE